MDKKYNKEFLKIITKKKFKNFFDDNIKKEEFIEDEH